MLLKLKRIKRQSKYQPMNEGHEAGSDAIKVKKNKKADFKTLNIHSAIQWERERERERERLKNLEELREGRTAGAGAEKQRVNGQRQLSDDRSTAGVYRSLTEHRSRGRSPICDEGRASTATTSELRRRGDVTVGLLGLGFYLCIGDFFFFFSR